MSNKTSLNIEVLYEDADCAVLNKPAGIIVHPDGRSKGPFLTDWVLEKFPEAKGVGEPGRGQDGEDLERSGIVHRLDRETSGAIIVAKTQKGFESLKKQFQDRTINKKYLAFIWGPMREEFGTIDRSIGRSGSDFRKWSAQRGARGEMREAQTYWTLLSAKDAKFSLIEAQPKTGRTHQIRVHMNAISHPVVGDSLYAESKEMALGFKRLALHSWSVEFENTAGDKVEVKAPLPDDFKHAVAELGINSEKELKYLNL